MASKFLACVIPSTARNVPERIRQELGGRIKAWNVPRQDMLFVLLPMLGFAGTVNVVLRVTIRFCHCKPFWHEMKTVTDHGAGDLYWQHDFSATWFFYCLLTGCGTRSTYYFTGHDPTSLFCVVVGVSINTIIELSGEHVTVLPNNDICIMMSVDEQVACICAQPDIITSTDINFVCRLCT